MASRFESDTRLRLPCIMLVGIGAGEEPPELGLRELTGALRVVRVRHALPACQRMMILHPLVVIVGPSVREWSVPLLQASARCIEAALLQLGPLVARDVLREWLRRTIEVTTARRARHNQSA